MRTFKICFRSFKGPKVKGKLAKKIKKGKMVEGAWRSLGEARDEMANPNFERPEISQ